MELPTVPCTSPPERRKPHHAVCKLTELWLSGERLTHAVEPGKGPLASAAMVWLCRSASGKASAGERVLMQGQGTLSWGWRAQALLPSF